MARIPKGGDDVKPDEVQAAMAMGNAVIEAISGRNTAYVNRTWGEMKRALEQTLGVADDDVLRSFVYGDCGTGYVVVRRDADGALAIAEVDR